MNENAQHISDMIGAIAANAQTIATFSAAFAAIVSATVAVMAYAAQRRPRIVAYVKATSGVVFLVIENTGDGAARDVVAHSTGGEICTVSIMRERLNGYLLGREFKVLMPGARRETALGRAMDFTNGGFEGRSVTVEYKGARLFPQLKTREEFPLDFDSLAQLMSAKDTRREMEKAVTKAAEKYAKG